MKVDKQKFIEALKYLKEINDRNLEDLNLEEFKIKNLSKKIEDWKFVGLNNVYFLKHMIGDNK